MIAGVESTMAPSGWARTKSISSAASVSVPTLRYWRKALALAASLVNATAPVPGT